MMMMMMIIIIIMVVVKAIMAFRNIKTGKKNCPLAGLPNMPPQVLVLLSAYVQF
jgi:hypothetical protein